MTSPILSRFDLFFILVDECDDINDYAIAKRIVDLHRLSEDFIDREYSLDEILRYITFAKQFKPTINAEAQEYIVEEYKRLRQRDAQGAAKSAWRVTVRQLESMIRLSESLARLHCQEEVLPKHVKEAFRLLSKSIIRVCQPDIQLEEESPVVPPKATQTEDSGAPSVDSSEVVTSSQEVTTQPKKMRLTYDQYKQLANMLVMRMRKEEEQAEENDLGTRHSSLVNWYLKEIEGDIETEEELIAKKTLVEKIIYRLIHHDHVLIQLDHTGLKQRKGGTGEGLVKEDDPVLVVHPNYVIDA